MVNSDQLHFLNASDRSYFAIIKKGIHALAEKAEFTSKKLAEIDIVVSEILSNLSKHAVKGELFVKLVKLKLASGIEIISIDKGPGISDVSRMMTDGMSTTNTLGNGLGAIKRLTDKFQVYSQKDWGTVLFCAFYTKPLPEKNTLDIKCLLAAKANEEVCGDGFYAKISQDRIKLFLGDGLGHGRGAYTSIQAAIEEFKSCPSDSPMENLRFIHNAVKKTRGLVGTVAILNLKTLKWKICGIGNIQTRMMSGILTKNHLAYNGIIGLNIPATMNDQEVDYEKGQTMIMCSDGIKTRWDLNRYPGILRYDMSILGAAIYKDFARGTDDISVVTCKIDI